MRNERNFRSHTIKVKSSVVTRYLSFGGCETGKKGLGIWICIPFESDCASGWGM